MRQKVLSELDEVIIKPYEKENPGKKYSIKDSLNYINIQDLTYANYTFMESLRIEPPVSFSTYSML